MKERWGGPACRIFRLLLVKRQLEQKQIAEMAMLPMKARVSRRAVPSRQRRRLMGPTCCFLCRLLSC